MREHFNDTSITSSHFSDVHDTRVNILTTIKMAAVRMSSDPPPVARMLNRERAQPAYLRNQHPPPHAATSAERNPLHRSDSVHRDSGDVGYPRGPPPRASPPTESTTYLSETASSRRRSATDSFQVGLKMVDFWIFLRREASSTDYFSVCLSLSYY